MSSRSKNGYVASYEEELDIMMFGLARAGQAQMYIGDDAGFDWGIDKLSDGSYKYVDTEIDGWVDRVGAKYSADDLTHIIADKAGWNYKTLKELAEQVVAEDMEYIRQHAA